MFQVQRFTDEQQDDDHGDDSTGILNRMLARAKARSSTKRARLGPDSNDVVHQQTAAGVIPQAGGCSSKASEVEDDASIRPMRTNGGEGSANGSTVDHRATAEDASEGTDDSSSSGEESSSSSSESGSESEEEDGDSSEPGADDEEAGEAAAIARGRVDGERSVEAGGQQGPRPMEEVAEEWGLDPRLTEILRREGVKHFFPIQVRVVPDIVATERHSHVQSRDMCVSAPTGSGKTLVFVLGVLQALIRRRVVRLRALVLLPSRDLAMQVHSVFKKYARGTGLRVGLAIGQTNFLEEQLALVGPVALAGNPTATARASFLRAQGRAIRPNPMMGGSNLDSGGWSGTGVPAGGSSEVDIVVATPGRLLDHLAQTPGFTLQHLRYLIIDEADRLLNQSYQGWVGKVIKAAYRKEPGTAAPVYERFTFNGDGKRDKVSGIAGAEDGDSRGQQQPQDMENAQEGDNNGSNSVSSQQQLGATGVGKRPRPPSRRPPSAFSLDPVTVRGRPLATGERIRGATVSTPPLRKLLFSATLTNNPQKLAGLDVVNPLIYTATGCRRPPGARGGQRVGPTATNDLLRKPGGLTWTRLARRWKGGGVSARLPRWRKPIRFATRRRNRWCCCPCCERWWGDRQTSRLFSRLPSTRHTVSSASCSFSAGSRERREQTPKAAAGAVTPTSPTTPYTVTVTMTATGAWPSFRAASGRGSGPASSAAPARARCA
ncbi:unnamed protein product [Ectocarpus sp. 6 AP-2014]